MGKAGKCDFVGTPKYCGEGGRETARRRDIKEVKEEEEAADKRNPEGNK